jgi:hypothetical protein
MNPTHKITQLAKVEFFVRPTKFARVPVPVFHDQ